MEQSVINEVTARSFLLGQLSPEEQERIEELAFDDPDTFVFIQAAQEDLIDEFVNDQLSPADKESFQNYFLAQPGRRQDLRIGRALQKYLAREEELVAVDLAPAPPKPSIFDWIRLRPLTVSLVLLILVAVVALVIAIRNPRGNNSSVAQIEPTPAPTPSSSPSATPVPATPSPTPKHTQSTPTPAPRQSVEPVYAVLLVPGSPARSEGDETKVRPVSTPVSFELPLVNDTTYRSYQALLQRNGKTIRSWSNLQPKQMQSGRAIKVDVPAGVLENLQHYRIVLNGLPADGKAQPVHNYYFQVSN